MLMVMDDDVCNICVDVYMYLHTSIYTHSSCARWKLQTVALASASAEFVAFTNDFQSFLKFSWRQRCLRKLLESHNPLWGWVWLNDPLLVDDYEGYTVIL